MISEPPIPDPLDEPARPDPPVVADWRDEYRIQIEEAAVGDNRDRPVRLARFGRWPTVIIDTIFLVVAEVILGILLATVAYAIIALHDRSTKTASAATDLSHWLASPVGLGLSALAVQVGIFLVLWLRVVRPGVLSWGDLGLGSALTVRTLRALWIGLGLGLAAFALGEVLLLTMHGAGLPVNGQEQALQSVHHTAVLPFVFFALTAAITAPIAEETFFRGYALRALAVRHGFPRGVAGSSLFFGLLHLTGGVGLVAVPLIVIGALLAWGYTRTGNLLTTITAHALNNLIGVIILLYST